MAILKDDMMYRINIEDDGHSSITCKECGMTSHHPCDVEHYYCSRCGMYLNMLEHPVDLETFRGIYRYHKRQDLWRILKRIFCFWKWGRP